MNEQQPPRYKLTLEEAQRFGDIQAAAKSEGVDLTELDQTDTDALWGVVKGGTPREDFNGLFKQWEANPEKDNEARDKALAAYLEGLEKRFSGALEGIAAEVGELNTKLEELKANGGDAKKSEVDTPPVDAKESPADAPVSDNESVAVQRQRQLIKRQQVHLEHLQQERDADTTSDERKAELAITIAAREQQIKDMEADLEAHISETAPESAELREKRQKLVAINAKVAELEQQLQQVAASDDPDKDSKVQEIKSNKADLESYAEQLKEEIAALEGSTDKPNLFAKGQRAISGIAQWFKNKRTDYINNSAAAQVAKHEALEARREEAYAKLGLDPATDYDSLPPEEQLKVLALEGQLGREYREAHKDDWKKVLKKKNRADYPEGPQGDELYYDAVKWRRISIIGSAAAGAAVAGLLTWRAANGFSAFTVPMDLSGSEEALKPINDNLSLYGVNGVANDHSHGNFGGTAAINDNLSKYGVNGTVTPERLWLEHHPEAFEAKLANGEAIFLLPTDTEGVGVARDGSEYDIASGRLAFHNYDPPIEARDSAGALSAELQADTAEGAHAEMLSTMRTEPLAFAEYATGFADHMRSDGIDITGGLSEDQYKDRLQTDPAFFKQEYSELKQWMDNRGVRLSRPDVYTGSFYTTGALDMNGDGRRDFFNTEMYRENEKVWIWTDKYGNELGMTRDACKQLMAPAYNTPTTWEDRPCIPEDEIPETPTPETIPETIPETVPETVPETTPETIPETTPETIPETNPETIPETTPETVPETNPETIPETIPELDDKIPEDDSNVHPDLPGQVQMGEDRVESGELQPEGSVTPAPDTYIPPVAEPSPEPAPDATPITEEDRAVEVDQAPVAEGANSAVDLDRQQELEASGAGGLETDENGVPIGNDGRVEG